MEEARHLEITILERWDFPQETELENKSQTLLILNDLLLDICH